MKYRAYAIGVCLLCILNIQAQKLPITIKNDNIEYLKDDKGNRVIDFSYCGYHYSDIQIPVIDNAIYVPFKSGDCSGTIQKAIDYLSTKKADKSGFRGAILLGEGEYHLYKPLIIKTSGIVLRGSNKNKTILVKNGFDRGACIYVEGALHNQNIDTISISDSYIPVNGMEITVYDSSNLNVGDDIYVVRQSTKEWISSVKCDIYGGGISALGWKPGDVDLKFMRKVIGKAGNKITLDAPLTIALNKDSDNSFIIKYKDNSISEIGIENLSIQSAYNKIMPKDEDHCWTGIYIENAKDCWVRNVNFSNLSGSAVVLQPNTKKITVEDCISVNPISEIGGLRRQTFMTLGQLSLFQRCYSEYGINDFVAGYCAAGPNAFVQCDSKESYGFSGSVGSMACGLLFDIVNIDGNNLTFKNLGQAKNGAGWNSINSIFWQCTASEIECYSQASDAQNMAFGCWAQFSGDGVWSNSNNHIQPRSLFYKQLSDRLGNLNENQARILPLSTTSTSSPTVEQAAIMAEESRKPRLTLSEWINKSEVQYPQHNILLKSIDDIKIKEVATLNDSFTYALTNGHITKNGILLVGNRQENPWWSGNLKNPYLEKSKPHITRFVPGREGTGVTDRIDSVVNYMYKNNILLFDHNYGLWYDRRRDDHQRVRRADGDVWAPFYEQPFGRSGNEKAWDGLSKYDLNTPNNWYWSRLKEFAEKAAVKGKLLFHQNYFQHNIIEAGAHWVDSPWRTANNINNTGFVEPVNFSGDKRIFVADDFYDVTNPVRREIHRNYIRTCLNVFSNNSNVVQLISAEYTGPLHFVQFWLDTIKEWENETGKHPLIALSVTKDVQDAILNDPVRSNIVDIIDIRYWHYNTDGVYAPEGGKNLAPRQHARKMKVGKVSFNEVYNSVSEYRNRYPSKAVTYFANNYPALGWAVFMAGGSCPNIKVDNEAFLRDAALMEIDENVDNRYKKLVKTGIGSIIYYNQKNNIDVNVEPGTYSIVSINTETGETLVIAKKLKINGIYTLKPQGDKNNVYWFRRL